MYVIEASVELFLMGYLLVLIKKGLFKDTEQKTVLWARSVSVYGSEEVTSWPQPWWHAHCDMGGKRDQR